MSTTRDCCVDEERMYLKHLAECLCASYAIDVCRLLLALVPRLSTSTDTNQMEAFLLITMNFSNISIFYLLVVDHPVTCYLSDKIGGTQLRSIRRVSYSMGESFLGEGGCADCTMSSSRI